MSIHQHQGKEHDETGDSDAEKEFFVFFCAGKEEKNDAPAIMTILAISIPRNGINGDGPGIAGERQEAPQADHKPGEGFLTRKKMKHTGKFN